MRDLPEDTAAVPGSATVGCVWCTHTESGAGYQAHDAIRAHQEVVHGVRAMRCGCRLADDAGAVRWWTCDEHSPAYLRQIVAWQIANYRSHRWAPPEAAQQSLFAGSGS